MPSAQFIYVRRNRWEIVGMIDVWLYFHDFLAKYTGRIGDSVRPSERRKGHAAAMLRETLPYRKEIGLKRG